VIYVELSGDGGVTRWAAELSNSFGVATLNLTSLEIPGVYRILVHASKGHDFGTARASVQIQRT